jgi:hypothetical protein
MLASLVYETTEIGFLIVPGFGLPKLGLLFPAILNRFSRNESAIIYNFINVKALAQINF